ncbi:MAG: STAS domain-containing protein [Bacillota bacterium]
MGEVNYQLPEEVTIYTVSEIKPEILEKLKKLQGQENLIFDCSELEEIDAAGVQLLLSVVKTSLQEEFDLFLEKTSLQIKNTLALLGVKEILLKEEISNG